MKHKQNNSAHIATRCLQLDGESTAKNIPVRIPNVSVYTRISARLSWDHPRTDTSTAQLKGLYLQVLNSQLQLQTPGHFLWGVKTHLPPVFRSPRGDCAHPWSLTLCTWHLGFGLAPMKLIWAARKGGGSLFLSCARQTAAAFSPWQKSSHRTEGGLSYCLQISPLQRVSTFQTSCANSSSCALVNVTLECRGGNQNYFYFW